MINATEFVELFESYRDGTIIDSMLNEKKPFTSSETGIEYPSWFEYLRAEKPEQFARREATQKKHIAKKREEISKVSPETVQKTKERALTLKFTNLFKDLGIISKDMDNDYHRNKKIAERFVDAKQFFAEFPEAKEQVAEMIRNSGLDPNVGAKLFKMRFSAYDYRKAQNAGYSKEREEHREPDDPLTRQGKMQRKEAAEAQMTEVINGLIDETDIKEFSVKLYDAVQTHDMKTFRPKLKTLLDKLPEGDQRRNLVDIALKHSASVKHSGKKLEDF